MNKFKYKNYKNHEYKREMNKFKYKISISIKKMIKIEKKYEILMNKSI